MPYIKPEKRKELEHIELRDLAFAIQGSAGEFNYIISRIAGDLVKQAKPSYARASAIRAAITDAAEEFYRRVMVPYEDEKIKENGDVY